MPDILGWRCKFGVVTPSTNTVVQPEYDDMRPAGVTNHVARMHIPNDPVRSDERQPTAPHAEARSPLTSAVRIPEAERDRTSSKAPGRTSSPMRRAAIVTSPRVR